MRTLIEDGVEKVKRGDTTLEELFRVIGPQIRHERTCGRCKRAVDSKYAFCPWCGTFKQNWCPTCSVPMEEGWSNCPFCGKARGTQGIGE
jgi:RNA polymerase subunit RPABC4/transcription elongation factor Spt4